MTRDDLLARLALDTNDLAAWTDLIRLDSRADRPTLTKDQAKKNGKRNHLVKIGTRPTQWPHLVDAARDGVCSWHVQPNPADNRLRGIVLIRPAADSPVEAAKLPVPPAPVPHVPMDSGDEDVVDDGEE